MRFFFFFLKKEITTHKLSYSKTMKSDVFAAFLGAIVGAAVSWISLAVLGGCSVDLSDLTVVCWYSLLFTVFAILFFKIF